MISTGNDIISLAHINVLRTKDKQFFGKIISPSDHQLFYCGDLADLPFEIYVWLAWSIKEAAFKYLQRQMPSLIFSPLKINIQSILLIAEYPIKNFTGDQYETSSFHAENAYLGTVQYGSSVLHSRSVIYHELIYSVVNEQESFDNIWWGIQTLGTIDPDAQSASVRLFILKKLHAVLPHLNITIGKSMDGIPVLLNEKKEMSIPVSFTHDHNYAGYSFVLGESFSGSFDIPIVTFED